MRLRVYVCEEEVGSLRPRLPSSLSREELAEMILQTGRLLRSLRAELQVGQVELPAEPAKSPDPAPPGPPPW